jgi:hypothetical protein
MQRAAALVVLFLVPGALCSAKPPVPAPAPPPVPSFPLPEVSGAVNVGGDRVLLIADEGYQVLNVSEASAAFATANFKGRVTPLPAKMNGGKKSKDVMDDIEDIAWDPAHSAAFAISSHSRSKNQDGAADPQVEKPGRHKLARLVLKDGEFQSAQEIATLEAAFRNLPFVAAAMKKGHEVGGHQGTFNIEGLAFDPTQGEGRLLIGLRSPTFPAPGKAGTSAAVVLSLQNPHALFDSPQKPPALAQQPILLNLEGSGIRGMTWDADRHGVWIVAGRSADPDPSTDHVPSTVWFWDPNANRPPRKMTLDLQKLESLESICVLDRNGQHGLLLISDDSKKSPESRYLWVPAPETAAP